MRVVPRLADASQAEQAECEQKRHGDGRRRDSPLWRGVVLVLQPPAEGERRRRRGPLKVDGSPTMHGCQEKRSGSGEEQRRGGLGPLPPPPCPEDENRRGERRSNEGQAS